MPGGDLCKRNAPRVELDQRARDTRLALEQIERLIVRAPDRSRMCGNSMPITGCLATLPPFVTRRTDRIFSCSMNTSTPTPAKGLELPIRPDGPGCSPTS
jgi:hypothetical protein